MHRNVTIFSRRRPYKLIMSRKILTRILVVNCGVFTLKRFRQVGWHVFFWKRKSRILSLATSKDVITFQELGKCFLMKRQKWSIKWHLILDFCKNLNSDKHQLWHKSQGQNFDGSDEHNATIAKKIATTTTKSCSKYLRLCVNHAFIF